MARPRIPTSKLSKSGAWSRAQRDKPKGGRCSSCGKTTTLVVHHKNGEARDDRHSNRTTLCRACHLRKHPRIAAAGGRAS